MSTTRGAESRQMNPNVSTVACRNFIGRREQLATLRERLTAAAGGSGSTVLLGGDAGIGKTRLIREFLSMKRPAGALTSIGECLEYAPVPYGPFADVVRAFHAARPAALGTRDSVARALSPWIGSVAPDENPAAHGTGKRLLFDAAVEALSRFSSAAPIVVVIEDLQWADPDTLDLAHHVVRQTSAMRVVVILTYRSDELTRRSALSSTIAKMSRLRFVSRMHLEPFDRREMHAMIADLLEGLGDLKRRTISHIHDLAEGNPLMAEELIRNALEGQTDSDLPSTLRSTILDRLAPLSDDERLAIVYAAIIGREFELDVLAAAIGRADLAASAVRRARNLQLIEESSRDDRVVYRFRHALLQEILFGELLVPERRTIHAKVAAALEPMPTTPERIMALAYHFSEAREEDRAAAYGERAGDTALALNAFADASAFYERALSWRGWQHADVARLYSKLASSLRQVPNAERAIRAFEQAHERFALLGDMERAAEMLVGVAYEQTVLGDLGAANVTIVKSLDMLRDPLSPVRYDALTRAVAQLLKEERTAEAAPYVEELDNFAGDPNPESVVLFHIVRGYQRSYQGAYGPALDDLELALNHAKGANDTSTAFVLSAKADILSEIGDAAGSLAAFASAADICEANLAWVLAAYPVGSAAFVCVEYGRLVEAREWVGRAIALLPRSDDLPYELICVAAAAFVANRVDDASECRRLARPGYLETAFKIGGSIAASVGAAFAEHAAIRKRWDEAREIFARCVRAMPSFGTAAWPLIQTAWIAQLPELAALRDAVGAWAAGSTSPLAPAHLAILDARCAAASGRRSEAVARAREAATLFARIDSFYFAAQALELAGDGAAALQEYRRAGAGRDVARVDEALSPRGRRGRSSVEMSRREREVADLVALGLTNKAIAAKLVISNRTVENHVSSVFHKLGVSTRAELAARAKRDTPSGPA